MNLQISSKKFRARTKENNYVPLALSDPMFKRKQQNLKPIKYLFFFFETDFLKTKHI